MSIGCLLENDQLSLRPHKVIVDQTDSEGLGNFVRPALQLPHMVEGGLEEVLRRRV